MNHKQAGDKLKKMDKELMNLIIETASSYGKSHKVCRNARNAKKAILILRNELDNIVCTEIPGKEATKLYFGQ